MRKKSLWVRVAGFLLFAELFLQIFAFAQYTWGQIQKRQAEQDVANRTWALQDPLYSAVYDEETNIYLAYQPFVGWRMRELHTPHINVDASGIRRTTDNPSENISKFPRIFFYGGSTMWGEGLSDEHTIPSLVSRELNGLEDAAHITNYGEIGYGSAQELALLVEHLKAGLIPDHVVFYDGCNDFFLQTLDDVPHQMFREERMRERLGNIWQLPDDNARYMETANTSVFGMGFWRTVWQGMRTYIKIIDYPLALYERNQRQSPIENTADDRVDTNINTVATGIADEYIGAAQVIEALASHYGFTYRLFWQPTLYAKSLTELEQNLPDADNFETLAPIYRRAAEILRESGIKNFTDLSGIFDNPEETVFTDSCHVTKEGNETVSREMLSVMQAEWGL